MERINSAVFRLGNEQQVRIKVVRNSKLARMFCTEDHLLIGNTIYLPGKWLTQKILRKALARLTERYERSRFYRWWCSVTNW
jgi:hypothetical protein